MSSWPRRHQAVAYWWRWWMPPPLCSPSALELHLTLRSRSTSAAQEVNGSSSKVRRREWPFLSLRRSAPSEPLDCCGRCNSAQPADGLIAIITAPTPLSCCLERLRRLRVPLRFVHYPQKSARGLPANLQIVRRRALRHARVSAHMRATPCLKKRAM